MDFYEQILRAIFTNNVKTVKQILDLDTEDILSIKSKHNGGTVLHYAAYCGSPDIVTYLLDQGAEKDAKNDRGETAVHIACSRKNSEALDSLLQMDAEAFPLTYAKRSPLHCCVTHNSIECIESLAVNDYNINLQDIHGTTALHIACAYGNHFLACWLLRHQADPEIPDKLGRLPVHLACSAGSQSVVLELVKRGVDLNRTDLKNRNVFHYACRSPQKQAVSWELIRYLSENALVSPWSADVDGAFPAMHALLMNKVKIARQMANLVAGRTQYAYFKLFLFAVSTVSSSSFFNHVRKNLPDEIVAMTDEYGYTPLHYAAQYDRDDRVTALISMGADLNARSNNGVTPLHCAALNGHRYVVEILLENQADENEINDRGHNALHLAAIKPYPEVCAMLLNAEVNIFARDFEGRTPLMYLCNTISETPESLQLLHAFLQKYPENHGESKLLNMKDKYGWTALHYASSRGHSKTALELIKKGADVCSLDKAGRNAAHLAVQCSKPYDVITVLCIRPSPILFQRDSSGFLPVHYAATKNDCNIVIELLEKQKCKVLPQTGLPFQLTPLHLAAIYGQTEVAKVIINFYKNQAKTKADNYEDCLRGLESLKINEDDSNTAPDKRNYDPLSSEDNMRRIPLHYAMKYGFSSILNVLMPRECSVLLGWQDCYGVNPLMMACANGHDDCVKTALNILGNSKSIMAVKKQTDTFRRCAAMFAVTAPGYSYKTLATSDSFAQLDRNKRGLIHRAAFSKKNDILRDILKWSPSEVNKPDINGVTPLHLSCFSGNLVGTQLLLKSGGSLSILDYQESAPADWAIACGHLEDVNFLLKHYKDKLKLTSLAICKASEYGFGKCVKQLIEHFPEMVRCQNKYHKTPLHLAAENGHQDICKLLVENGAFMDTLDVNKCTPLMLGAKCKSGTESVAYLVDDADCPLTPKDIDGNSALHLACINDNVHSALKIFEALINRNELNTMTSQKNSNLETLLHLAVKMNSSTMTETFLKYMKRQLWEKDANGRIPLVCMVDNPAIINNMWLLLMELVDIGRSMGKDLNNDSSIQSELEDDSSHNSSFNSAETMTGERWSEQISAYDEVAVLKKRIFKKKGIVPSKQALVFCGNALADNQLLTTAGLRNDSVIKFVVIARTGPVAPSYEEVVLSDDPSDWEIRGRRVMSTAEDTSAKESAGETEVDGESGLFLRKPARFFDCTSRRRTRSQNNSKDVAESFLGPDLPSTSRMASRKDSEEAPNAEDLCSEDLSEISEVSSGMLVCDLTNEFRKIKIKKHRHPLPYHLIRQRNRSKTRGEEREVSSSDENESIMVDPSILSMCSQNPHRRTTQRPNAPSRCTKCAFKVTNPFFCRCGKTLCSKHRIHTCTRQRTTKLQEVSD